MAVYVIYTLAGKEKVVEQKIRELVLLPGEDVYIPTYNRQKKIHGKYEIVTGILFPGYIFYETEDVSELRERLRMVLDVTKLLGSGNFIIPLRDEEEVLLYKLCGKEHVLDVSTAYYEMKEVRVIQGPLMGMEARIKKINRHKQTAVIEVEMLHRIMEITVGLEILY